jgi:hypothetical protein
MNCCLLLPCSGTRAARIEEVLRYLTRDLARVSLSVSVILTYGKLF